MITPSNSKGSPLTFVIFAGPSLYLMPVIFSNQIRAQSPSHLHKHLKYLTVLFPFPHCMLHKCPFTLAYIFILLLYLSVIISSLMLGPKKPNKMSEVLRIESFWDNINWRMMFKREYLCNFFMIKLKIIFIT